MGNYDPEIHSLKNLKSEPKNMSKSHKNKQIQFLEAIEEQSPPEIISEKNEVEIIIKKGITVKISTDLSAETLIKIIELLRNI